MVGKRKLARLTAKKVITAKAEERENIMTNLEILANELLERELLSEEELDEIISNGNELPFATYQEWLSRGFKVKKGEHCLFSTRFWKKLPRKAGEKPEVDENGKVVEKFYKKLSFIFSQDQVERLDSKAETRKAEPKKVAESKAVKVAKTEQAKPVKTAKATKKTAKKVQPVKAEKKAVKTIAKTETRKTETKKESIKEMPPVKMLGIVKDGMNFIRIENYENNKLVRWVEIPQTVYTKLSDSKKKAFQRMWGMA